MNVMEIQRALKAFYEKKLTNGRKRHIVFWYDEAGDFIEEIEQLQLENVRVWTFNENNLFATKYELEKQDTTSDFLLYARMPKPRPEADWLYDQYKLGQEFSADKMTIIMRELGISDDSLKAMFKHYEKFFDNKVRRQSFYKHPVDKYTEEMIDLTVLAALVKSNTNTLDDIVRTLLRDTVSNQPKVWKDIEKYGDVDKFWLLVEKYYRFNGPEKTLASLATYMMLTYMRKQNVSIDFPRSWGVDKENQSANVIVFMDQWMNHGDERVVYNKWARQVEEALQVRDAVENWDVFELVALDVFPVFEERLIHFIVEQLLHDVCHFDDYREIIDRRRKMHWYRLHQYEYEAMYQAIQLFSEMDRLDGFILEEMVEEMFHTYVDNYYRLDTAYRKFYNAYDQMEDKEMLHALREKVERVYVHDYLEELAIKWANAKERAESDTWGISGLRQQNEFYNHYVRPYVMNEERVFVIISDAFRYEVANELMNELKVQKRANARLHAMQGVLPSYTALGMAALLPHKELSFSTDGKVSTDGVHASTITQRSQVLKKTEPNALAIAYNDLASMNRSELRQTLNGKKVTYIYHNTIDARGDNAATEAEIFQATEEAVTEIRLLVNQLVNNVSASNIIVTADHGFLYQRDRLENSQKLPVKPDDAIVMSRRFAVLGEENSVEGTLTYPVVAGSEGEKRLFVTVPRGIHRFAIQGAGTNYVHGGAMLQEIVVPVIVYKNNRSTQASGHVKKVDVKLTTPMKKITHIETFLEFFQSEKVEDKKQPNELILYFVDEGGNRISNENKLIADSTSSQVAERTFKEKFIFQSRNYDPRKRYDLILEAALTGEEYDRYTFTIDVVVTGEE